MTLALLQLSGLATAEARTGPVSPNWSIEFAWNGSAAVWAPLLGLSAVLLVAAYFRLQRPRRRGILILGILLRVTAFTLLLWMWLEPLLVRSRYASPVVWCLIDDSLSMSLPENLQTRHPTRIEAAKELLLRQGGYLQQAAERGFDIRIALTSAESTGRAGEPGLSLAEIERLEARGQTSPLGRALRRLLATQAGDVPTALVLLSDGIVTEGPALADAAVEARQRSVPVFAVGLGADRDAPDIRIHELLVDETVFAGDPVLVQFSITGRGFSGRAVDVVLRNRETSRVVATTQVRLADDDSAQDATIFYRPEQEGLISLVVEAAAQPGESGTENNSLPFTLQVVNKTLRALLVSADSDFEFRFLKNLLEREPSIELRVVLQNADADFQQLDSSILSAFPVDLNALGQYDVLILNDTDPALLGRPALESIRQFVSQQGGGAALIAGPDFMPRAYGGSPVTGLLPFEVFSPGGEHMTEETAAGVPFVPTPLGMRFTTLQLADTAEANSALWESLPGVDWFVRTDTMRPAARVLAEFPGSGGAARVPAIMTMPIGAGRVLFHASDETWKWRKNAQDTHLSRYWVQSLRWLGRGKLLAPLRSAELQTDKSLYRSGEDVLVRARYTAGPLGGLDQGELDVILESFGQETPGANRRTIRLRRRDGAENLFEAAVADLPAADYRATLCLPRDALAAETMAESAPSGRAPSNDEMPGSLTRTAEFRVADPPPELRDTQMDGESLREACRQTGGQFFLASEAANLVERLPQGEKGALRLDPSQPLWNRPWLLAAFIGLLGSEWLLRRNVGLP